MSLYALVNVPKTGVPIALNCHNVEYVMTFTIQNAGTNALGPGGGSLGYGWNGSGVTKSVAVKF
jgi:hypothetical protein